MHVVCLDLEGVLVPEIWVAFAERTGIPEFRRTTRDEPDYDKLMRFRLGLLREHRLKLSDIQDVIAGMAPLEGARAFLDDLRAFAQRVEELRRALQRPHLRDHVLDVAQAESVLFEQGDASPHQLVVVGLVARRARQGVDRGAPGHLDPDFRNQHPFEIQTDESTWGLSSATRKRV